jgi:Xaa-Pro aminopeptidase
VVDVNECSYRLFTVLKDAGFEIAEKNGIVEHLKACKNKVQQEGMRNANIRDCAAIMKYFAFLEEELHKPDHGLDEYSGARMVEEYRTFGEKYVGPSFDTISSIGPNGAVIHYKPK